VKVKNMNIGKNNGITVNVTKIVLILHVYALIDFIYFVCFLLRVFFKYLSCRTHFVISIHVVVC